MMKLFLFVLFVLFISTESFFLSRRRRAPQKVRIDCKYTSWKTTSTCSKDCGPDGVEVQERSVAVVGRNGGKECDYSSLKKEIPCNRFCMNEGTVGDGKCNCLTGWEGECCDDDVDECSKKPFPCEQNCKNAPPGTYTCSCNDPDLLDTDNKSCIKIESCRTSDCQHRCKEPDGGGVECYCNSGYTLGADGKSCNDINECEEENECVFKCKNTEGSYDCLCKDGYYLNPDHRTCTDIDECKAGSHNCKQICLNLSGSFKCGCRPEHYLDTDGITCIENKTKPVDDDNIKYNASTCETVDENGKCLDFESNKTGFDKDDMYNVIIGTLLGVVFILFAVLGATCMRKGYKKLYPPKPPPVSTIPRFNNTLYNGDLDDNASGVYADPNYEELPDVLSPEYMDMNTDEKAMCGGGGDLPPGPAENHYEDSQDLGNYSARRGSGYMQLSNPAAGDDTYEDINEARPSVIGGDYIYRGNVNTSAGFTHEEDEYVNQPQHNDNI